MSFSFSLKSYKTFFDTSLEETLPSKFARYASQTPWTHSLQDYVLGGGKRLRPILAMMYAQELGFENKNPEIFNALEVFHDFILAHDDIVDQDAMRWGNPTIHTRLQTAYPDLAIHDRKHFGQALAMIGGDVLHAIAQSYILQSNLDDRRKIILLETMNEAMLDVARGRYKQFLSDSMNIADVSLEYILNYNLRQVTGSYTFLFPLRFGHVIAMGNMEIDARMMELCRYVGILFQTGDDMIGLFGDPSVTGKSNDGDIIQGKKTIPLYFAYQSASDLEKSQLDALIGKQELIAEEAHIVKAIIQEHGVTRTQAFLDKYAELALSSIEGLQTSEAYKQWWRELVEYLLIRNK